MLLSSPMPPTIITNPSGPSPLAYGAMGDSYGFCFEFASAEFVRDHNNLSYRQHPEFKVTPGVYSDDTQMQLALAEVIASGLEWSDRNIADSFVKVFKRDPRQGYARRFQQFLESIHDGEEFLAKMRPDSERNGAAMRGPIVGLFREISEVIRKSEIQARITHNTKGGIDSATAAALISHFFAYDLGPKSELPSFLNRHVPGYDWSTTWKGPVEVHGIQTVRAALTALMRNDSLSTLLIDCVNFTGDVDSVAAVALASAGGHKSFARDLPLTLWNQCEQSTFGIAYLQDLDRRVRALTIEIKEG